MMRSHAVIETNSGSYTNRGGVATELDTDFELRTEVGSWQMSHGCTLAYADIRISLRR